MSTAKTMPQRYSESTDVPTATAHCDTCEDHCPSLDDEGQLKTIDATLNWAKRHAAMGHAVEVHVFPAVIYMRWEAQT